MRKREKSRRKLFFFKKFNLRQREDRVGGGKVEIMMQFQASDIKLLSLTIISHYIFASTSKGGVEELDDYSEEFSNF
jgi:hypothetical protein